MVRRGLRQVAVVTGTGHWFKSGAGLVAVRWVFVEDQTGTHRDESFFTTDVDLTPKQVIEAYTGRWAIEVMFEEVREHVGLELTEGELEIQVRGVVSAGSAGRVAGKWESIQIQAVAAPVETLMLGNLLLAVDTGTPGDGATSVPQIAGTVLGAFSDEQLGVEYDINGDGFADGSVAAELDGTFVIDLTPLPVHLHHLDGLRAGR